MGREGLDTLLRGLHDVYELHQGYRAFLNNTVEGYVCEKSGDIQIIPREECDIDQLYWLLTFYENHNVGVMRISPEHAEKIGVYVPAEELDRCA